MELTTEKSHDLASTIEMIKMMLHTIDVDYAKEVVKKIKSQASFQDSAAVLSMSYMPEKTTLLRRQADMLKKLIDFIEIGKECDELKKEIFTTLSQRDKINKMFL